jgi:hypothetical protein
VLARKFLLRSLKEVCEEYSLVGYVVREPSHLIREPTHLNATLHRLLRRRASLRELDAARPMSAAFRENLCR